MVFEFTPSKELTLLENFATFLGSKMEAGRIEIPENIGKGYVQGYMLASSLKMMIHRYVLKEDLIIRRIAVKGLKYGITFTFNNILPIADKKNSDHHSKNSYNRFPSVQITSSNIDYEILLPANTYVNTIVIVIHLNDLSSLLNQNEEHELLRHILLENKPYFYEEMFSSKIQSVTTEIFGSSVPEELSNFFYKLKSEELIYLFFIELLKRPDLKNYPLNTSDVRLAHLIREKLISDLSVVPNITELARFAGMSESKLKRLFKQIFGNSIYNYYQTLRMKKAAELITEKRLSVSEAGYTLGFSNLSHFSRLFEKHIGLKPKKYSATHHD